MKWNKIISSLREFSDDFAGAMLHKGTAQIEYEAAEMEHSFALMLFGNFAGLPSPPMPLAMDLLPVMGDDLEKLLLRASETGNGLSELASILGEP